MLFNRQKKKRKKQEALFEEALKETGIQVKPEDIRIDHPLAKCYYRSEEFTLLFPLRFLRLSRHLSYEKPLDYCFRGLQTTKRDWVNSFAGERSKIMFTDQGRVIEKDLFDEAYYQEMANTKFTLCPSGDFKWTYRFLEAIMCRSIPVIEPGSDHPICDGFTYFYSDTDRDELLNKWNENILIKNYNLFLNRHTLLNRFIFFEPPLSR